MKIQLLTVYVIIKICFYINGIVKYIIKPNRLREYERLESYKLFLDESENKEKNILVVAGVAIECSKENDLEQKIYEAKRVLWDDVYIQENETVLHCTELSVIKNNKNNSKLSNYIKRDSYRFFENLESKEIKIKIENVVEKVTIAIDTLDITILGCVIDLNKYDEYYSNERDDIYDIAIENILENYVHFLKTKNAVGDIFYESRDVNNTRSSADVRMYQNYCSVIANNKGILSVGSSEIKNRLRNFVTVSKTSENSGIEMADFIAFYLSKSLFIDEYQKPQIIKSIEKKLYNGLFDVTKRDLRAYYGLRKVPFDVELLINQDIQIKKLKSALKNKKNDVNKLDRKVKQVIEEKRKKDLEIEQLKNQILELKKKLDK